MKAKCVFCRRIVSAAYQARDDGVFLTRNCGKCGPSETLVSTDPGFFKEALFLASSVPEKSPSGIIVELLDQCDIQCPTCIAGSGPALRNLRSPAVVRERLVRLEESSLLTGVFLSGGEPAVHPDLGEFMKIVVDLNLDRRVLITNGLRLARDVQFQSQLLDLLQDGWEVFLQFDVLDGAALRDIRGDDFIREREAAVEALGSRGIPTTLVAVAKRAVSLHLIHKTVQYGLDRPWVRGVQIQPIREAGRLENYKSASHTCLASDVHEELRDVFSGIKFSPYAGSPLSVSLAYADRGRGNAWMNPPLDMPLGLYIEPTTDAVDHFRVSVMEYSDDHNWSSLRLKHSPLAVLQSNGSAKRVDDHWDSVGVDLGPLRTR